jgi:hypothetical protein
MGRKSHSSFPELSWDPFGVAPEAPRLEVGQIDLSIRASWADEWFSHYPYRLDIVNNRKTM